MGKEFDEPSDASLPGGTGEVSIDNPYSTARITETAHRLNILPFLVSEPTVNEYLGAYNELSDIEQAMIQAREALLTQEDMSISPGVGRRLQANYSHALGFNRAALLVIEDGLHVRSIEETTRQMEVCLTPVLSTMGMYLDKWKPGYQPLANGLRLREYEEANRAQRARDEQEYEDLRYEIVQPLETGEDTYLGIGEERQFKPLVLFPGRKLVPTARWQHSSAIQSYAAIVNTLMDSKQHLFFAGVGRQVEMTEGVLSDADGQRFGLVRGMVYAMEASVNEGIIARGNEEKHTPAYQYASYLNQFLWVYGRQVVW